jgi:hypothetical protein
VPYQYVVICETKVKMDVGYWIQVDNCKNLGDLLLKQDAIHNYHGSVTPKFSSNADFDVKADFTASVDFGDFKWKTEWSPAGPDGAGKGFVPAGSDKLPLTVTLSLWDVRLNALKDIAGGNCKEVGKLSIKVRPRVVITKFWDNPCGQ